MSACSFDRLLQFVHNKLDLDRQLEVYDHLDGCGICRDAVYHLLRDMKDASLIHRRIRPKGVEVRRPGHSAMAS